MGACPLVAFSLGTLSFSLQDALKNQSSSESFCVTAVMPVPVSLLSSCWLIVIAQSEVHFKEIPFSFESFSSRSHSCLWSELVSQLKKKLGLLFWILKHDY